MQLTRRVVKPVTEVYAVTFDVCGTSYPQDDKNSRDPFELQEFTSLSFIGGYGSVFGDGLTVESDIYQNCLKKHLGPFIRLSENI